MSLGAFKLHYAFRIPHQNLYALLVNIVNANPISLWFQEEMYVGMPSKASIYAIIPPHKLSFSFVVYTFSTC